MTIYLWEETHENIYDSLPAPKSVTPGPEVCLLHSKKLKDKYQNIENSLKGKVLPWNVNLCKIMKQEVCCCPTSKRNKQVSYGNLPKDIADIKHWQIFENLNNLLNADPNSFPQDAIAPLNQIMQLHLQTKLAHYEIFLQMLLDYVSKPYRDQFTVEIPSEDCLERVVGTGDFSIKMLKKNYKADIAYELKDKKLTVFICSRSIKEYKEVKEFILAKVEDCASYDSSELIDMQLEPQPARYVRKKIQLRKTLKMNKSKNLLRVMPAKCDNYPNSTMYQSRYYIEYLKHKRCGLLKHYKQNVSWIGALEIEDPSKRVNYFYNKDHKTRETTEDELNMLHILMEEEENTMMNKPKECKESEKCQYQEYNLFQNMKFVPLESLDLQRDINEKRFDCQIKNLSSSKTSDSVYAKSKISVLNKFYFQLHWKNGFSNIWLLALIYIALLGFSIIS